MKHNLIRLILLGIFFCGCTLAKAQLSADDFLDRSYEIQTDEAYFSAMGFGDNADNAYQGVVVELLEVINQARRNERLTDLRKNDIEMFIEKLYTEGDVYDLLLYVPKDKVLAIGTQNITGQSQSQSGTSSQSSTSSETFIEQRAPVDFDPNDIIQTICNQDTYIEIKGFIERWKQEGKIVFSGMTKNPAEVPADANAIVIGDRYKILAVLSPKNKNYRIDYKTGDEDDESKHPDFKFIVWYRTNNSK